MSSVVKNFLLFILISAYLLRRRGDTAVHQAVKYKVKLQAEDLKVGVLAERAFSSIFKNRRLSSFMASVVTEICTRRC